jgi:hypothetical protein
MQTFTSISQDWYINTTPSGDMFTFKGPYDPTNIYAAQLEQVGVNEHSPTIPVENLMNNIKAYKGSEFMQLRFKGTFIFFH